MEYHLACTASFNPDLTTLYPTPPYLAHLPHSGPGRRPACASQPISQPLNQLLAVALCLCLQPGGNFLEGSTRREGGRNGGGWGWREKSMATATGRNEHARLE